MKKILILNGSPRQQGNTAFLAEQVVAGAAAGGGEAEIIRLQELEINPCDGCDSCQKKSTGCVINDDMHDLYPKLEEADVIVIATPVYWCSMTAQIKACIDRWYALQSDGEYALKGKELALLMVYGDDDLYASGGITIIHTLEGICRYVGLAFAGIVHGSAMDIADASNDPLLVKRSFKLGKQLAES